MVHSLAVLTYADVLFDVQWAHLTVCRAQYLSLSSKVPQNILVSNAAIELSCTQGVPVRKMGNIQKRRPLKAAHGQKAPKSDDFPLWGVQLSFLRRWTVEHVKDETETTAQVCSRLILPSTTPRRCSMVEYWGRKKHQANRFVSHSWSYRERGLLSDENRITGTNG
jgi:hypothetical protein